MSKSKIVICVLALMLFNGCQQKKPVVSEQPTISNNHISVNQLAEAVGMEVSDETGTYVTLKDEINTLLIFTYSDGFYYINGKKIGGVGKTTTLDNHIMFDKSFVEKIKPQLEDAKASIPAVSDLPRTYGKVMIDPGHGGKDPGAIAITGLYEKTVNLQVSEKVAYLLRKWGISVVLTRSSDVFIELDERCAMCNRYKPDIFVSIHADACNKPSVTGYSIYVGLTASNVSKTYAGKIVDAMENTGFVNRGVKKKDLRVLMKTDHPAVLVEMGYLSNRYQAGLLAQKETQEKIAYSIARGIYDSIK